MEKSICLCLGVDTSNGKLTHKQKPKVCTHTRTSEIRKKMYLFLSGKLEKTISMSLSLSLSLILFEAVPTTRATDSYCFTYSVLQSLSNLVIRFFRRKKRTQTTTQHQIMSFNLSLSNLWCRQEIEKQLSRSFSGFRKLSCFQSNIGYGRHAISLIQKSVHLPITF